MASRDVLKILTRARKGEPEAQLEMGRLYLVGAKGISPNPAAAMTWLLEAWRRGQTGAANDIVGIEDGPVLSGEQQAVYLDACQHLADQGSPEAAYALAEVSVRNGDPEVAMGHFRSAADQGHSKAAFRLGAMLLEKGTDTTAEATQYLKDAVAAGEDAAVPLLASAAKSQDDEDPVPWLRKLAENGDLQAMDDLASLLLETASEDDITEARKLLVKASQRGHPMALWRWGRLQVRQFRTDALKSIASHSPRRAIELLERAAAMGIVAAHWDLSRIYALPQSSVADLRAARRHLEVAADAGIAEAQVLLASRLIKGRDDPDAWIRAGRLLEDAKSDPGCQPLAERMLSEIADLPRPVPVETPATQDALLAMVESRHPALAVRLRLAARFGLSTRETLFLDVVRADHGWCLLADLRHHFRYRSWRLIRVTGDAQREALNHARMVFLGLPQDSEGVSYTGATRARARRLVSVLQHGMQIDPAMFIGDWQPPS